MERFLKLYTRIQADKQSLELTLEHDKVADWCLVIYHRDSKHTIFNGQDTDIDNLSNQAYDALCDWFIDNFKINLKISIDE